MQEPICNFAKHGWYQQNHKRVANAPVDTFRKRCESFASFRSTVARVGADAEDRAKAFGEWVKTRRTWRRLSRAKLALAAGISPAHLKSIEDGGRMMNGAWMVASPGDRILLGLADALEEDPTAVFEAAGVPVPAQMPTRKPTLPTGVAAEGIIDVSGLPAEDVEMIKQQVRRLKRLHGLEE